MVLSQWNVEELLYGLEHNSGNVFKGIPAKRYVFKGIPAKRYVWAGEENSMYRYRNWIFDLVIEPGKYPKYFMVDTFGPAPETFSQFKIEVTDQNVDEFEFLFNRNDVVKIHSKERNHYNEFYTIADLGGDWQYPTYYVDKGAKKNPENIAKIFDNQIKELQEQIKELEARKESVLEGILAY